ncbi:MAG: hypothetical protein EA351_01555 [Gemmatimonadales bacterium]|nr:MAG: hypothetical protein EA351_01555 [Gemmatimonadales bacterium]
MMIRRSQLVVGALLALVSGCEPGSSYGGERFVVSDSAGVVLAENAWSEERLSDWEPVEPPIVRLGSERADAPDLFGRVGQVYLDPRGNLWIVDVMSAEARVFQIPSGEHLFTVGGRGEGPGEFRAVRLLGFDDTRAWIWDQDLSRLTVFTLDGEFMEVRPLGRDLETTPRLHSRTAHGTFVASLPQFLTRDVTDGMNVRDTIRLWEFEAEIAEAGLLAERPGVVWHFSDEAQHQVPFTDGVHFAARDRWVVVTDPEGSPELEVLEEGRVVRRVRLGREPTQLTSEDIETFLEVTGASRRGVRAERLPIPRFAPAWSSVQIGQDGSILALHHWGLDMGTPDARAVWDVFDPDGRLRVSIRLPQGTSLLEFGREYLILQESPEGEGPRVAVYAFPEWRSQE